jgi:hypothetical protein
MGHWADDLLSELKTDLGITGDERDAELRGNLLRAQADIELLTGHRIDSEPVRARVDHGNLPFLAALDMQTATLQANAEVWPIPDPVHPEFSNVLQLGRLRDLPGKALPKAEALSAAAAVVAELHRTGWLRQAAVSWFLDKSKAMPPAELGRMLLDEQHQHHVPVACGTVDGWGFQVSRRIVLVPPNTPNEPGLVEILVPVGQLTLVATEPIVVVARVTSHPADWALAARIWVHHGIPHHPRTWRATSGVIHGNGIPIITLDEGSTPEEVVAQMLLVAYWHGYLDGDEASLIPVSLASAFQGDVARVKRGIGSSDMETAASSLFERLLRPGFDPTRGAGSIRHYIAHHATTLIREHRATLADSHPWDEFEIEERQYYKLLARFAPRGPKGRYEIDDAVRQRIRDHVEERRRRAAAMDLLRARGFGEDAARKWLQRHDIDEIATAQPRRPRMGA